MKYVMFEIENYRAIKNKLLIELDKRIIPIVGINECGKSTILQAIYSFDYNNDGNYSGQHLNNTQNLYETSHKNSAIITAIVDITVKDLYDCLENICPEYLEADSEELHIPLETFLEIYSRNAEESVLVSIKRDLSTKEYSFNNFFDLLSSDEQNKLGKEIVDKMPYIIYSDDFTDRPTSEIKIESNKEDEWTSIFKRIFETASNGDYTLEDCLKQKDENIRKSMLSDVQAYLSGTLTEEWQRFSSDNQNLDLILDIDVDKSILKIKVNDRLNNHNRYFELSSRSKGFIWYYNFIMKVKFNPKRTDREGNSIFLLDEPGSYLHESAQKTLCENLKSISESEGVVIYCTHSASLLNPKVIPVNNILVVDKSAKGYITTNDISNYQTYVKKNTPMQPIFEALRLPEYEMIATDEKIVCVEGIYDKYVLEMFCELPTNTRVFPSVNADSIKDNISYFIAYNKDFVAIWDDDSEGRKHQKNAIKYFGVNYQDRFLRLPGKGSGTYRMEEMFTEEDNNMIRNKLGLNDNASYNSFIGELYYLNDGEKRSEIISSISKQAKDKFIYLAKQIKDVFSN